ncbi:DMT family transporter [Aliiruegeria sabulilitoris]|uniref:DMT family transporter n=1 Tax=Aliiruegeria sabulilitoris TaxID=1510458 RepID=UPI003F69BD77
MSRLDVRPVSDNLVGAAFMVAAMAGFAFEDMFLKRATAELPVGQALAIFGLLGTIYFSARALSRGEPVLHPLMVSRPMLLRALFEGSARMFYTLAIAVTALSNATAIMQATPIVVVAGAALFMHEQVGWRRWLAIWIGFGGVLLILRPGAEGFDAASILVFLGMLGFAGRDLATRAAPLGLSNAQLGICGFSVLIPVGLLLLAVTGGAVMPSPGAFGNLLCGSAFGLAAYSALTQAMRTGEVSVVTPFRYSRLLFGVALGMLFFGERPDLATYIGSAIILASGLFIMFRQGRRK